EPSVAPPEPAAQAGLPATSSAPATPNKIVLRRRAIPGLCSAPGRADPPPGVGLHDIRPDGLQEIAQKKVPYARGYTTACALGHEPHAQRVARRRPRSRAATLGVWLTLAGITGVGH